ncbi:MAG TPA: hypothetical protein VFW90_02875 [Candidatus Saccharimonadales bacterium]|nr:hypothetical protein [Candidatus Saccharimonadales bacterium]
MSSELKEFSDLIMGINAPAISVFGGSLPGMLGRSAAEQGSMTPSADTIHELKRKVANFNKSYGKNTVAVRRQEAKKIEGLLLNLQAFSVIDERQADDLIDRLHKLSNNG